MYSDDEINRLPKAGRLKRNIGRPGILLSAFLDGQRLVGAMTKFRLQ